MGNVTGELHVGCTHPNPVYCKRCAFSHGATPAIAPIKAHCLMYPVGGELKPNSVLFEGKECVFFEQAPPDQFRWTDDKSIPSDIARWLEGLDPDGED